MLRRFGSYLLAHDRNANIAAFLSALLSLFNIPIGFLAVVVVGLVTLQKGWKSGLVVLSWAILPVISLLVLKQFGLFDGLLVRCVAIWLLAILLRKTHSLQLGLQALSFLAALGVIAVHIFYPDVNQWWHLKLVEVFQNPQAKHMAEFLRVSPEQMLEMVNQLTSFATGFVAAMLVLDLFTQLLLARWWENALYFPGRMREEFNHIHMNYFSGVLFLLASVGLYWHAAWLIDVYPVLVLPFAVAGLSVFHQMMACKKAWIIVLVLLYLLLFFVTIPAALFLALVGLLDSGYDFRKRCAALQVK